MTQTDRNRIVRFPRYIGPTTRWDAAARPAAARPTAEIVRLTVRRRLERERLIAVWRIDPDTGRLECRWVRGTVADEDLIGGEPRRGGRVGPGRPPGAAGRGGRPPRRHPELPAARSRAAARSSAIASRASASARSLRSWPAWPRTQCQRT